MVEKGYKYAMWGIIAGFVIMFVTWLVGSYYYNLTFSFNSFSYLHSTVPVYYIIDILPILLGTLGFWVENEIYTNESLLLESLKKETSKSNKVLNFVNNLIQDNFETSYEFTEENDKLGKTLVDLRDNIKKSKEGTD